MNVRYVLSQLGVLFVVLACLLLVTAFYGLMRWYAGQPDELVAAGALTIGAACGALLGGVLWFVNRRRVSHLGRKEALLLVALSWLIGAAIAAAPFLAWSRLADPVEGGRAFDSFINCYFEAMSGLTTTGATVLTDLGSLPKSLLLWRAATHWLGGLGIVVLFVAVLPSLGVGGKKLFRAEAPGPEQEGVHPHIRETARMLWLIYFGLTLAQTIALRIAGMSWIDALCHTFATLATGGFSTTDASIGGYDSVAVHIIVIVFMVAAGVNFGLYYQLMRKRWTAVLRDVELRFYLGLLLAGTIVVSVTIWGTGIVRTDGTAVEGTVGNALLYGGFTTVSIQTTTGFCTADFNLWPFLAKGTLLALMFVGGSAGSTGGGIKVIRIWIAGKILLAEIERVFRPHVVRPMKIGRTVVSPELKLATVSYILGIILLFAMGAGLLMILEDPEKIDFATAATASVATLCNIGPGLAQVGAVENYEWFSGSSKLVMSMLMALGRLEIFAIIVLFDPRFWKSA